MAYRISQELEDNTLVDLGIDYSSKATAIRVCRAIAENPPSDVVRLFVDNCEGIAVFTLPLSVMP